MKDSYTIELENLLKRAIANWQRVMLTVQTGNVVSLEAMSKTSWVTDAKKLLKIEPVSEFEREVDEINLKNT